MLCMAQKHMETRCGLDDGRSLKSQKISSHRLQKLIPVMGEGILSCSPFSMAVNLGYVTHSHAISAY